MQINRQVAATIVTTTLSCAALAEDFRARSLQGIFDVTLSYGATYRVEDTDDDLVVIGNRAASFVTSKPAPLSARTPLQQQHKQR